MLRCSLLISKILNTVLIDLNNAQTYHKATQSIMYGNKTLFC